MSTYREDDGSDVVVKASGTDGILVSLGRTGLIGKDEASTDPHGRGSQHQGGGERLTIEETSSGNDLYVLASQRALLAPAHLHHGRDEHGGGHVAGVATALAALGADHVGANLDAFLHMLGVTDHVHVQDSGLVQTLHDTLRGHTHSRDEELGSAVDDDGDEFVELALGVVVAIKFVSKKRLLGEVQCSLGLSCAAANLRNQEIDSERCVLVVQEALQLGNLLAQHLGGVTDTTNDTKTSGIGDGGGELRASGDVHAGQHDGVVDLQEIGACRAKLLCTQVSARPSHVCMRGTHVAKPCRGMFKGATKDFWDKVDYGKH